MPANNNSERRIPDFDELSFDMVKLIERLAQTALLENSITPIAQHNSAHLQGLLDWTRGLKSNVVELRRPAEPGLSESTCDLEALWLIVEDICRADKFAKIELEQEFRETFSTNRGFFDSVQHIRDTLDGMMGWSDEECEEA